MVIMELVRGCNERMVHEQPIVAVFVGGTSGIGSYAVKALARHAKPEGALKPGPGLRLYIVGRNKDAADKIITECQTLCPIGQFIFIKAENLALIKDVDSVCAEIIKAEQKEVGTGKPKIDILVMTQAFLAFDGRRETKEGLDELMSLLYYSRIRFTENLISLLLESPLPAHVISVFGPQRDEKLYEDDISLRNPKNYGFGSMGSHAAYMKTFYMEHLAEKYAGKLALCHYFPGLVVTEAFTNDTTPAWFRFGWKLVVPFSRFFSVPQEEAGERVLFLASKRFPARGTTTEKNSIGKLEVAESSDGVLGGGAYRVNWDGTNIPVKKNYKKLRADGWAEKIEKHTQQAFRDIESKGVFTG